MQILLGLETDSNLVQMFLYQQQPKFMFSYCLNYITYIFHLNQILLIQILFDSSNNTHAFYIKLLQIHKNDENKVFPVKFIIIEYGLLKILKLYIFKQFLSMSYPNLVLTIQETLVRKTNIVSSLDINHDQNWVAVITRQRATNSAKWVYSLQLYELIDSNLNKIQSIILYQTYKQRSHYVKFLGDNKLFVITTQHVTFYNAPQLQLKHKYLHQRSDIYGVCVNPDGSYATIVSDNHIITWDTSKYQIVNAQIQISEARKCDYSKDYQFLAVSTNTTIIKYEILGQGQQLRFENSIQSPQFANTSEFNFGAVQSFEFSPLNSSRIVIGFSKVSPRYYTFGTQGETLDQSYPMIHNSSSQPYADDNLKEVTFLPDGQRVLSSDYKQGIGLWPGGSNRQLLYKQNFLLFGLKPFDKGRKAIGFVWKNIKIIEIRMKCNNNTFVNECSCGQYQYWNKADYTCKACPGIKVDCSNDPNFSTQLGKYYLRYQNYPHASKFSPLSASMLACEKGYYWNSNSKQCIFDCNRIQFASPSPRQLECSCQNGMQWDNTLKRCVCPYLFEFDSILRKCSCASGLVEKKCFSQEQCVTPNNNFNYNLSNCQQCGSGLIFGQKENIITGRKIFQCRNNCTAYNYTADGLKLDGSCQCTDRMAWKADTNQCQIQCSKVDQAEKTEFIEGEGCQCSSNFLWNPENFECTRNCSNVSYIDENKSSTAISCPCKTNFRWDQYNNKCKIDCQSMKYAEIADPLNQSQCICRDVFYWHQQDYKCVINCSSIWDAQQRISDGQCKCNNNKTFNQTNNICNPLQQSSILQQWWIWLILALAIIFVIGVSVVMIRYCCKFSTEKDNKQHNKKLKMQTQAPKKRKKYRQKKEGSETQRIQLAKT